MAKKTAAVQVGMRSRPGTSSATKDGRNDQCQPSNFVIFRPKKEWLRLELALDRSEELQARLDDSGVDVMDYDARWGKYRLRLAKDDLAKHKTLVHELIREAYDAAN